MKGMIALDIDGTITSELYGIPAEVVSYLSELEEAGWKICFITGRGFDLALQLIHDIPFPYYLGVLNGSILLEMPKQEILQRRYLDRSILPTMSEICEEEPTDCIIYAGFEFDDACYYRPHLFEDEILSYVVQRTKAFKENWYAVESFDEVELDHFAVVKCLGPHDVLARIAERVRNQLNLTTALIRDPHREGMYVLQSTGSKVDKGQALRDFKEHFEWEGITIAAGDDFNDLPMLKAADVSIAMGTAPEELFAIADVRAKTAEECGILHALKEVIQ